MIVGTVKLPDPSHNENNSNLSLQFCFEFENEEPRRQLSIVTDDSATSDLSQVS